MKRPVTPLWVHLLDDTRLSREARLMALHLVRLGDGEHQVSTQDWQRVLGAGPRGVAKRQSIAQYMQELEVLGWIRRREGGSGSPYYQLLPSPQGTPAASPVPSGDARGASAPVPSGDASGSPVPSGDTLPSPQGTPAGPLLLQDIFVVSDSRTRTREQLHPDAEHAIEGAEGVLNGCRGALRDYLAARVKPERQYGYVQRLVTSLQGADEFMWADKTGRKLTEGRTGILAAALNELIAGSEVGEHFSDPPGGFSNLRSMVRYLVASHFGAERDATRTTGSIERAQRPARQTREVQVGE